MMGLHTQDQAVVYFFDHIPIHRPQAHEDEKATCTASMHSRALEQLGFQIILKLMDVIGFISLVVHCQLQISRR